MCEIWGFVIKILGEERVGALFSGCVLLNASEGRFLIESSLLLACSLFWFMREN